MTLCFVAPPTRGSGGCQYEGSDTTLARRGTAKERDPTKTKRFLFFRLLSKSWGWGPKFCHTTFYSAMFARATAAVFLALPLLAAATGQCNTGEIQCCNSVQNADSPSVAGLLGILGIAAQAVTGQVGVTCSPLTVIGGAGNSCTSQPVCCTNNSFNGIVALGCTPINLNL